MNERRIRRTYKGREEEWITVSEKDGKEYSRDEKDGREQG